MNELIKNYLRNNLSIIKDRGRLKGLLKDFFNNDEAQVNAILAVYDENIITTIENGGVTNSDDIHRLVMRISKHHSMESSKANQALRFWIELCDAEFFEILHNFPYELLEPQKGNSKPYGSGSVPYTSRNKDNISHQEICIPCGVGNQDFGFYVHGLTDCTPCRHSLSRVLAVLFSMFQKTTNAKPPIIFESIKSEFGINLDYSRVFRLLMVMLLLVKTNNIKDNTFNIQYDNKFEIETAIRLLNYFTKIICTLAKLEYTGFSFKTDSYSLKISLDEKSDIYTESCENRTIHARYMWIAPNIIYKIEEANTSQVRCMEILLKEFFSFDSFQNGQLQTIISILDNNAHKICVMPTGSGKSLIFYFTALLRSSPTFVVAPTQILIKDQLRNLKNHHNWDDACEIDNFEDFTKYSPTNKLMYLTPETFLNRDLINRLIGLNYKQTIGNVVLDEVHCISNWSHDFRPEYLMLSFVLREFVDKTGYLCFTATANYTVMKDILYQLDIDQSHIISPLSLSSERLTYSFNPCDETEVLYEKAAKKTAELITKGKRALGFSKSRTASMKTKNYLPPDSNCDIYDGEIGKYIEFSEEKTQGLITDNELGIGINLPNISGTIHIGMPISKSQYVQEIGRSAREPGTSADSFVYYLNKNSIATNHPDLIKHGMTISDMIHELNRSQENDDYLSTLKMIFNGAMPPDSFYDEIVKIWHKVRSLNEPGVIECGVTKPEDRLLQMRCLYVLFRVNAMFGWYIVTSDNNNTARFHITPLKEPFSVANAQEIAVKYIRAMGKYNLTIRQIKDATEFEQIIRIYVDWYYNQFLYHHREQVLEMLEFLEHFNGKDNEVISDTLKSYFSLGLLTVDESTSRITGMTLKDITLLSLENDQMELIESVRRGSENENSAKIDYFLFCCNAIIYNDIDISRLERALYGLNEANINDLLDNIHAIYEKIELTDKLRIINKLCTYFPFDRVLDAVYSKIDEDDAYAVITLLIFNRKWGKK